MDVLKSFRLLSLLILRPAVQSVGTPPHLVLASIVVLILQVGFSLEPFRRLRTGISATVQDSGTATVDEPSTGSIQADLVSAVKDNGGRLGGPVIFLF